MRRSLQTFLRSRPFAAAGRSLRSAGLALVLGVSLIGLHGACDSKGGASADPGDAEGGAPEVGKQAPSLALAKGDTVHNWDSTLAGKVVLVDFWASWCGPCKEELPELEALYKKFSGQGVEFIGVSVDEDATAKDDFLARMPLSFPVVHDDGGAIAGRYNPPKMPTSYVVGKTGMIALINEGYQGGDIEKIEATINAELAR
jgi:thiol-disulfide isomerase/thioredoxin